ncbi:hypothetical protein, partial [Dysosmobacter sp.]|uniref:hypothetical protein n=1 Tax=Dysosmobacter sp. TaxID=2591382 RepID=UPI003AAD8F84
LSAFSILLGKYIKKLIPTPKIIISTIRKFALFFIQVFPKKLLQIGLMDNTHTHAVYILNYNTADIIEQGQE